MAAYRQDVALAVYDATDMRRIRVGRSHGAHESDTSRSPQGDGGSEDERSVEPARNEAETSPLAVDDAQRPDTPAPAADLAAGRFPGSPEPEPEPEPASEVAAIAERKVAGILGAAERAADELRTRTEDNARDRIAEADRAADNRVKAAEEEAAEILASARQQAAKVRDDAKVAADKSVTEATNKGLEIVGNAEMEAKRTLDETAAATAKAHEDAAERSRELMRSAQETAAEIRDEGFHMVGNLRDLGDSMRNNAEKLLKDVQMIHTRMVAQIERVEAASRKPPVRPSGASSRSAPRSRAAADGDSASASAADSGSASAVDERPDKSTRTPRRRVPTPPVPDDVDLDVPEFMAGD